jgi:lantibiotic modifying enzyme
MIKKKNDIDVIHDLAIEVNSLLQLSVDVAEKFVEHCSDDDSVWDGIGDNFSRLYALIAATSRTCSTMVDRLLSYNIRVSSDNTTALDEAYQNGYHYGQLAEREKQQHLPPLVSPLSKLVPKGDAK